MNYAPKLLLSIINNIINLDSCVKVPGWQKIQIIKCKNIFGKLSYNVIIYIIIIIQLLTIYTSLL